MDFESFDLRVGDLEGPAVLDAVERDLWVDVMRAPVLDAVAEQGLETRRYGPLQATVVASRPEQPLLNLLLGGAEPGAVSDGHLEEALDWVDSLGLDCRVPLDPDLPEAGPAEELLNQWRYRRAESQVRFVRDTSAPIFGFPDGVEVIELEGFTEGFGDLLSEGYELGSFEGWLFDCLPGREGWRCYVALDEREWPRAAAAMLLQWGIAAHFAFAATEEEARGRGFHKALLARCIRDAKRSCPLFVSETRELWGDRDGPSQGCCNLLRSGFHQASVRTTWRPVVVPAVDSPSSHWGFLD